MSKTDYITANTILSNSDIVASSGQTKDFTEVLLGLGEGPIAGPVDGLKSIYLGTTAIMSATGVLNFKDLWCSFYPGDHVPDSVNFALGGSSASTTVGVLLADGTPITRTTSLENINTLDVRIAVSQCITSDGKTASAAFSLQYKKTADSTWLSFGSSATKTISGKYATATAFEYRQVVEKYAGTYDIRITPTSCTATSKLLRNITWESFQEITTGPLTLPNTALLYVGSRASNQYSQLPEMWGVYGGFLCHVPTNYDPVTRVFTGVWDGTFKFAATDDPAWIIYEIVTNTTWGFNAYFPCTIDKYDCYEASQWTSEQVSDGTESGTQCRYTFNQCIANAQLSVELLNLIASTFGGHCFDDQNGTVLLKVDKDDAACKLFIPENVENGVFNYSYSDVDTRFNYFTAKFPNPDLDWNMDRRVISNPDEIAKFGKIPTDVQYDDCIYVHEAIRRTYLRMMSACTETELVSFRTNRLGVNLLPFDVFLIADSDMAYSLSGRVKAISTDRKTITLRDALAVEAGTTYTVTFETSDGLLSHTFTAATSTAVLSFTLGTSVAASVLVGTSFSLGNIDAAAGLPRPYRLLSITEAEGDPDKVDITGLVINRAKWAAADAASYAVDMSWSNRKLSTGVSPATGLGAVAAQRTTNGVTTTVVTANWTATVDRAISHYKVTYTLNGSAEQLLTETEYTTAELSPALDGDYVFYVYAVNIGGYASDSVSYAISVNTTTAQDVAGMSGLEISGQGTDTVFVTKDVKFDWRVSSSTPMDLDAETSAGSGAADSTFRDYVFQVYDVVSGVLVYEDYTVNTYYTFTYDQNYNSSGGPRRTFKVLVRRRDVYGNLSAAVSLTVSNPAPAAVTNLSSSVGTGSGTLKWPAPIESDIVGFKVHRSATTGFTPGDANIVYDGPNTYFTDSNHTGTTQYYRVAAYDAFDSVGLNYSNQFSIAIPQLTSSELSDFVITATKVASGFSLPGTGTSFPASPTLGQVFTNSTTGVMYLYTVTGWQAQSTAVDLAALSSTVAGTYATSSYLTSNYLTSAQVSASFLTISNASATYQTASQVNSLISSATASLITQGYADAHYSTVASTTALQALIGNSSSTAILRMYVDATPGDATARTSLSVSASGTGGTHAAYMYMDAMTSGSRLVFAADSVVLTASKTIIATDAGVPIALFNSTGLNANAITAGTLDVDTVISAGALTSLGSALTRYGSDLVITPGTAYSFVYPISCPLNSTTGAAENMTTKASGYVSVFVSGNVAITNSSAAYGRTILAALSRSTDSGSTWTLLVDEYQIPIWTVPPATTSASFTLAATLLDASPVASSTVRYRVALLSNAGLTPDGTVTMSPRFFQMRAENVCK